ncbi:MAG TPA: hypothetical protein GXX26_11720 [Clostridiaceae bacterium]|nr:hypothetical protein [Clostridiaceae bacterium]
MSAYAGFIYIILTSIYTFSYAKKIWQKNKAASIGAILIIFISLGAAVFVYLRT